MMAHAELRMSALGQNRAAKSHVCLPPKADMCSALAYVRFGPKADITFEFNRDNLPRRRLLPGAVDGDTSNTSARVQYPALQRGDLAADRPCTTDEQSISNRLRAARFANKRGRSIVG